MLFNAGSKDEESVNSRAPKKRLRSNEEGLTHITDEETVAREMLMLKAEALIHLHQPLEALQLLNRYSPVGVFYCVDDGNENKVKTIDS